MKVGMTLPSFVAGVDGPTIREWCRRIDDGPYSCVAVGERVAVPEPRPDHVPRVRRGGDAIVCAWCRRSSCSRATTRCESPSRRRPSTCSPRGGSRSGSASADATRTTSPSARSRPAASLDSTSTWRRCGRCGGARRRSTDVPPIGPAPVQPGGPPLLTAAMGPKSLARSAVWADGLSGFDLAPDPASVASTFATVRDAWTAAGRTSAAVARDVVVVRARSRRIGTTPRLRPQLPLDVRRRRRLRDGRAVPARRRGPAAGDGGCARRDRLRRVRPGPDHRRPRRSSIGSSARSTRAAPSRPSGPGRAALPPRVPSWAVAVCSRSGRCSRPVWPSSSCGCSPIAWGSPSSTSGWVCSASSSCRGPRWPGRSPTSARTESPGSAWFIVIFAFLVDLSTHGAASQARERNARAA